MIDLRISDNLNGQKNLNFFDTPLNIKIFDIKIKSNHK